MQKINIFWPFIDYLYIYQSFEYESFRFLVWFFKNPFRQNLQRKHTLKLTVKALSLAMIALIIYLAVSLAVGFSLGGNLGGELFLSFIIFVLLAQISPLGLVLAQGMLWPFEEYQKKKIVGKARTKRTRLDLKAVTINGSFAKTSIKDMLYSLIWRKYLVVKTPKSYNTLIAVARSILADIKETTQVFIAEMDAYYLGEIDRISALVKPNIAVITSIAPQHLERFGSMEDLAKTQFEVVGNLSRDGVLILNGDDEMVVKMAEGLKQKKIYYGRVKNADYRVDNIRVGINGTSFRLIHEDKSVEIVLNLVGEHHAQNFAVSAAVASILGMSLEEIKKRAQWILPTPHRMEILKRGAVTIIDNSYNSNPVSVKASLRLLSGFSDKEKVLITPGFSELGSQADSENEELGVLAGTVADWVIIVGESGKEALLKGLDKAGFAKDKVSLVSSAQEGVSKLDMSLKPEYVVLIENDLPDQYN